MFEYRWAGMAVPDGDGALPRGYARGEGEAPRPRGVWVDLAALFPARDRSPSAGVTVPDGLELAGEVHGLLHYWARGSDGRWVAVVSFRVPFRAANRNSPGLEVRWVPVPASTVRPDDTPVRSRGEPGNPTTGRGG